MKIKNEIDIPDGVNASIAADSLTISGAKGKIVNKLPSAIKIEGKKIILSTDSKERVNTTSALIKSAFKGALEGYSRKMKMIFAHFPMTVEVKGKEVYIKNFLGEKVPRVADIVGDSVVKPEKEFVTISGPDKHAVGQTVANIKIATKIKDKDPRTFQDGLYEIQE
jgi:large subunit ribosomal protein L6